MDGEDRQYWRVLMGYVSAQLQSRLVSLDTAIRTQDNELIRDAAASYQALAELTAQLHSVLADKTLHTRRKSHGMKLVQDWCAQRPCTNIDRKRRLPQVLGNEVEQLRLLQEIMSIIGEDQPLKISYRQRQGELIMRIASTKSVSRLWYASRNNRLRAAARSVSEESLRGLLLGERLYRAQMYIRARQGVYYVHFYISRQLTLPM